MKIGKTIGASLMILLIGVISFISFFGMYDVKGNRINILPDYKMGLEFSNTQDLVLSVKEGTTAKEEEYKTAKDIITKRLNKMKIGQYIADLDKETGTIKVQIKESEESLYTLINLMQRGVFNVVDSEDNTIVLLDNNDLKNANVRYSSDLTGVSVYLQCDFNEEGAKKLEEISKTYVETTTEQENEEGEMETVTTTKNVSVQIDGTTYSTTYFGEQMTDGTLYIPLMSQLTSNQVTLYEDSLNELSIILNNGVLPDIYEYSFSNSEPIIGDNLFVISVIAIVIIFVIAIICLMIRFKAEGIVMGLMETGYMAVLLIALRYANVTITISGVLAIVISGVFNYILLYMILEAQKNGKKMKNAIIEFLKVTIPVYVVAIILTFIPNEGINSAGMTLFWGSLVIYAFNFIFTKPILKMSQK